MKKWELFEKFNIYLSTYNITLVKILILMLAKNYDYYFFFFLHTFFKF